MIEWISVNDRLPDTDPKFGMSRVVLCMDACGRVGFGIYTRSRADITADFTLWDDCWFTTGVAEEHRTITHWTELDKPAARE